MTSVWGEGVWGTFVWGDRSGLGRALSLIIEVDWDGDGLFDGVNEAVTYNAGVRTARALSLDCTRGRQFFLASDGTGFVPIDVGTIAIVLKDLDGRYNPYNTTGPLFSYLQQNQKVRVRVEDTATGTIYPMFTGYIDDIRPNFSRTVSTAMIIASDGVKRLARKVNNQNIYQALRFNAAIAQVLTDAGWNDGTSLDSTASDTMPYWWESGRSAFAEISDLVSASFGAFSITADGRAKYLSSLSGDIAVMTLTEDDIQYGYGIQVPSPREVIRNSVKIYARSRQQQTLDSLWQAVDKPSIPPGGSLEVWADFTYNGIAVPALTVTTPVATTDYTANTAADGSGTDKTAQVSLVFTRFGTSAKMVFTNNDAGSIYMTLMKVRGVAITADPYTFAQKQDAASIASYTQRDLSIQTDWLQDLNSAVDKANTLLIKLANPKQFPRVMVKRNLLAKSLGADLFNVVSVNFPSRNVSGEFRVGYIHHSWAIEEESVIDTTLYLEPNLFVNASGSWIFPALIGTTTKFA